MMAKIETLRLQKKKIQIHLTKVNRLLYEPILLDFSCTALEYFSITRNLYSYEVMGIIILLLGYVSYKSYNQ